jgi:hypothetical protein
MFILHHQRFDHDERILPQNLCAVVRPAMFKVVVGVLSEANLVRFEQRGGRCFRNMRFFTHATDLALLLGPVTDIRFEHLVFKILRIHHRFGDVVKADHTHQHAVVDHGHVSGVAI